MTRDRGEAVVILAPSFVHKNGEQRLWGSFKFVQLPAPGDHINIRDHRDRVQRLKVMYVAHEPLGEWQPDQPDRESAWVHAEWIDEFY